MFVIVFLRKTRNIDFKINFELISYYDSLSSNEFKIYTMTFIDRLINPNIILFFSFIIVLGSCSRNPVTGKREIMLMSESQEIALGQQSDPQIVAAYGLYQDDKIQAFIQEKGKEMAAISHRPDLDYEFKVLDSPVINAFAVPGGYVYFTRGILAHFNNEAEFAGVLGHEIGHITARHSAKQQTKAQLGQVLFIGGMIASESFRNYASPINQGMGLLFLKFGRDDESQSDKLGAEYSTEVGYDANEMANFFGTLDKMRQQSGQSIPDFLSTHPNPADREQKVHIYAATRQSESDLTTFKVNRDSYLRLIDGIKYGEDPRAGFFENNIFYHPDLKFQFPVPSGWQTQNLPSAVQMAPQANDAMLSMTLAANGDLRQIANKFVTDNNLSLVEQSNTTVNGLEAYALITSQAANQQAGQPGLKIMTYFIKYNNNVYQFNGIAETANFNKYFNTFRNTMKSFNQLTDPEKLNRQARTLKIVTVKQNSTLRQALESFNAKSADMNDLSLLNGMELGEQVTRGMLIKTLTD